MLCQDTAFVGELGVAPLPSRQSCWATDFGRIILFASLCTDLAVSQNLILRTRATWGSQFGPFGRSKLPSGAMLRVDQILSWVAGSASRALRPLRTTTGSNVKI